MCLQASVCCTSAPQKGQALIDGVDTPITSLSGQLCNICTRGSLPPSVFITVKNVVLFVFSVRRDESSYNSTVPSITRSLVVFSAGTFFFISLNRSVHVASYHIF